MTTCPRCQRRTPASRGECIYCGESLPFTNIESAPPQRNIGTDVNAFNTVLDASRAPPNSSAVSSLASALQIELSEAQVLVDAGKPVPIARSQTHQEAEMICALVRKCALKATVVGDEELRVHDELIHARSVTIADDEIEVRHSSGTSSIAKSNLKLIVLGGLHNTRVDYIEGIGGRGKTTGVLDSSEYRSEETLLDVYAASLSDSFRIKSDAFDYSGLVSPMSLRSDLNFKSAVQALREAVPRVVLDDDFRRLGKVLARAWPERTHNETRGIKRTGLAFRAVAQASAISNNRDQFERYSKLMFFCLLKKTDW